MGTLTWIAGVAAALAVAAPATAAVVYDHAPLNGTVGAQTISVDAGFPVFTANAFTLAAPVTVNGIQFGMWDRFLDVQSLDWSIATGPTLANPTIIASGHATDLTFTATNIPGSGYNGQYRVRTVSFDTNTFALGAQTYWLRLSTPTIGLVGWDYVSAAGLAEQGFRPSMSFGTYPGRNSFQLLGPDAAPPPTVVPEPAAWALMVGGFGLAGAAMRRRRAMA